MRKKNVLILAILFFPIMGFAQQLTTNNGEEEIISEKKKVNEEKKAARKAKKEEIIAQGKPLIFPFVGPGYTPELGGVLGVGALVSFKTNPNDSLIQRSSLPINASYSTTGAFGAKAMLTSYWFKDKLRINFDFRYKDMPDNYWGVGYEKGFNIYKSDSTTAYQRVWMVINPKVYFRLKKDFYVGLNLDYNYTKGWDASKGVASDSIYQQYNDRPLNSGVGIILRYDSRDIPVNAWKGILLDIRATAYLTGLGGVNKYRVYQLDYRQYKTIRRDGQVIAWQIKTRIAEGEVPYGEMSQLGTPQDLRGYTWGRYRDNDLFFFLTEYRYTFLKSNKDLSMHGAVVWVGAGTIFNTSTPKDYTNRWLPSIGIGYRLEVQPRMAVRIDLGIGRETTGFYFNFNQAF